MPTVKIKTEPTATATTTATATAVDVKVKYEPSLSTADIKLEQDSSDIDTKFESDSEGDIKSENDDEEDTDQNQAAAASKKQRQFICEHSECGRGFNYASNLKMHRHEHRLQTELSIRGKTYTLTRQSLNDRWSCPNTDCEVTAITVDALCLHVRTCHSNTVNQQQQQQPPAKKTQFKHYFLNTDDFYVNGVRCGYHNTTGVLICYECRLVPECLLTHLQQKHGYDEKSVENKVIPESAVTANIDPSINQHTSNPHLESAIRQPFQQQHQDIVQGWLCVTSDCGYCNYTAHNKYSHKRSKHQGEQLVTVPALLLRLSLSKTQNSYFLIINTDQTSRAATISNSRVSQHKLDSSHNGLNTQDESEDDTSQNETIDTSNRKPRFKCEYPYCGRFFNSYKLLGKHRREHKLEVMTTVQGTTYTLSRQSSDERWPCPIPDCDTTYKAVDTIRLHIQNAHGRVVKQKRTKTDDNSDQRQQQQQMIKKTKRTIQYLKVDDFYIGGTRCGYHNTTGVFICHECRLVPESLLSHLQQKHGYDEKSIENECLAENAKINGSDPNGNQHSSNPHLASAIIQPYQQHHPDIGQGWLCVAPDCGYCYSTKEARYHHQLIKHKGGQQSTVPALVLRLLYGRTKTSGFLITRLDTITTNNVEPDNCASLDNSEYIYEEDDGDELVLSDMGDEDDLH